MAASPTRARSGRRGRMRPYAAGGSGAFTYFVVTIKLNQNRACARSAICARGSRGGHEKRISCALA